MVIHELNIDGIDHILYIKAASKGVYYRLCMALLSNISDADQTRITHIDKNQRRIVFFTDLVRCFERVKIAYDMAAEYCICGKKDIVEIYLIRNISTREQYIVGSTCARNWFSENKVINGCMYCNRINKNGGNFINCSGKMNLKSVFFSWKNEVMERKEMVSFGKYKDVITYRQLCSDIRHKSYVDWCLDKSTMKEDIKSRLQYFVDKHREVSE